MSPTEPRKKLDPAIRRLLAGLRRRIRAYALLRGVALSVVSVAVAFWATLALDYCFEPILPLRWAMLLVAGGGLLFVWLTTCALPTLGRLPDRNMAMVLERFFPHFDESLLTSVELLGRPRQPADCCPAMLDRCHRQAVARVEGVRVGRCFRTSPLWRSLALACVLTASVAAFAVLWPENIALWARRLFLASQEPWPSSTRLVVEGFDENGVAKVANGDDFVLRVRADLSMPVVPKTVQIRGRTENGRLTPVDVQPRGAAVGGRDGYREYVHIFRKIGSSIELEVRGGDDVVDNLRIEVVQSPVLIDRNLECVYPEYMARKAEVVPIVGVTPLAAGTRSTLVARANKGLVRAVVRYDGRRLEVDARGARPLPAETAAAETSRHTPGEFTVLRCPLAPLRADRKIEIDLFDVDGLRNRRPIKINLAASPDRSPKVTASLRGIGEAITPDARLPIEGLIEDDFGVARAWAEYAVGENSPAVRPIDEAEGNITSMPIETAFEVGDLGLSPGEQLTLCVAAADRSTLGPAPNVGRGPQWSLAVVTPKKLLSMLEAREIVIRQRFEQLIEEVRMTRASFDFMTYPEAVGTSTPDEQAATAAEPPTESEDSSESAESSETAESSASDGSSDEATNGSSETRNSGETATAEAAPAQDLQNGVSGVDGENGAAEAERIRAIRALRLARAQRDSQKEAYETKAIRQAFLDIRDELENNRLYTEERKERIETYILGPLEQIVDEMFPELDRRMYAMEQVVDDPARGPEKRELAKRQLDAIIRAMQRVRDRMVEMETFNEAIELLRSIIESQRELRERTQERQQEAWRDLLGG